MPCADWTKDTYSERLRVAAATCVTMEEILSAPNTANAACVTVKLLPREIIIKEIALQARPCSKGDFTARALAGYWLSCIAKGADDLLDVFSIEFVSFGNILQASSK